jgi:5-methylcytosine-specific restriction endonuclease McrA
MNAPEDKRLAWRVTPKFIIELLDRQKGMCANLICSADIREEYDVDHIMPIILGGLHSADNIQLLCPSCNRSKAGKHPDAWRAELGVLF